MLKSFDELYNLDISKYTKKREAKDENGRTIHVDYLPWAKCVMLLRDNGAEKVYFEPCVNSSGSSLFMSDHEFEDKNGIKNRCYEVRVHTVIDDLEFDSQFPLMNGSNPVKDNSLTQQRLWNAQTRAFVKGVAMRTGLGFSLWAGFDEEDTAIDDENLDFHNIYKIKERMQQEYTAALKKYKTAKEVSNACGISVSGMKEIFNYFDEIAKAEEAIRRL